MTIILLLGSFSTVSTTIHQLFQHKQLWVLSHSNKNKTIYVLPALPGHNWCQRKGEQEFKNQ